MNAKLTQVFPAFALAATTALAAPVAGAADGSIVLADRESFRQGNLSLRAGRYREAAGFFLESWEEAGDGPGAESDRGFIAGRLVECWSRADDREALVGFFRAHPDLDLPAADRARVSRALRQEEEYHTAFEELRDRIEKEAGDDSGRRGDLLLLAGLLLARENDPQAFEMLAEFRRDFPDHPSRAEADLAVAELHLNQVPPRLQLAREILGELRGEVLTIEQGERLDYTALWVEAIAGDTAALEREAGRFLRDWRSSPRRAEVETLLAGRYFQRNDFASAHPIFLSVAERDGAGELSSSALFFAARSAPLGEDGLALWDRVIEGDGPLALAARHEKGLLLASLGRFGEAREMFQSVIDRVAEDSERRFAAMCEIGHSYYLEALSEGADSELLSSAAEIFGEVSRLPRAGRAWRYEASVRRGKCVEALGIGDVALEIYRSLVEDSGELAPSSSGDASVRETEWLYRAGFAAIAILESKEDWAGAIKLANVLAEKNGPRAIEANRYAERMRLKHWVWE